MPDADVVILDECHRGVSPSWMQVVEHYRAAGSYLLGITATPLRLDGKPLGQAFERIVQPVTTRELVDGGYLILPRTFAPPVDLDGLPKRGGDYSLPELADRMSPLCGHVIRTWERHARGLRTLAFAVNIEHSRLIEDGFRRVGARVAHVDGKTPDKQRREVNERLRAGDLDVVTQCALWTEGVDIPELGCLVIARPTKSLGLHRQMIGRVMRPAPGKTSALVLDHAGNYHEHGSMLDEIEWSLSGPARRPSAAEPVRTCKECFAVLLPGVDACQECGAVYAPARAERSTPGLGDDSDLIEVGGPPPGASATPEQREAKYRALVRIASERGRRLGWARHQFKAWTGSWPRMREIEAVEYRCGSHEFDAHRCVRCYAPRSGVA